MDFQTKHFYAFGPFRLDSDKRVLVREGVPVALAPKVAETLRVLVKNAGRLVEKDKLMAQVWPDAFVEEGNLSRNVFVLRQLLGEWEGGREYIETVPKRGYRFVAPVEEVTHAEVSPQTKPSVGTALIGKKVSHYRVLEIIGGGGMGLVYRAEDVKLGRQVALKFLPEELRDDPKALGRFEREAQAVSALNHPNICYIHELDEHEGQPFIVMELLQGQTLREHLAAGHFRLSEPEGVQVAVQIAAGLEAAHEKGIIHRDVKPANIFITEKNVAKILDFGVAKVLKASEPQETAAAGATAPGGAAARPATINLTRTGLKLGTAGYMSPEQVRGEPLDARTDIFSFGLVLYEMATGERAFTGETEAILHEAIVTREPRPVRELAPGISPKLAAVIARCLEKEREQRFQSAAELRSALEEVRKVAPFPASSLRNRRIAIASLAVLLILAGAVALWWRQRPLAQRAFQKYRITALTSVGNVAFAATSPDGRYLAYADEEVGNQSIWLQQLATSSVVRILGPVSSELVGGLRFTPDGNYLYYTQEDAGGDTQSSYRLAVLGGSPQMIASDVGDRGPVDVSPDGKQIVYSRLSTDPEESYLLIANADGSAQRRLLTLTGIETIGLPAWSPDGQTIAFGISEGGAGHITCVAVVSSQGGTERRLLRKENRISGMAWLPDQSGLVIAEMPLGAEISSLWILPYPGGELRKITNDLDDYSDVSLVHDGGRLVTAQKQMDSTLWVAPALNPSQATPLREGGRKRDGVYGTAWLSDGRIVYAIAGSNSERWLVNRDGSQRRQLTHTNNIVSTPSSMAATDKIVFARMDPVKRMMDIWITDSSRGDLRQITTGDGSKWEPQISPDGKWITYNSRRGPWKMTLSGGEPVMLGAGSGPPAISPDGRWIAFERLDDKEKKSEVEILAADGKAPPRFLPFVDEPQIPESANPFGVLPIRWTADGKAITYVRTKNGVSNIWAQPIDGSPARQLTNFNSMLIWSHAWSQDGKWLVMARGNFSRDAVMLTDVG